MLEEASSSMQQWYLFLLYSLPLFSRLLVVTLVRPRLACLTIVMTILDEVEGHGVTTCWPLVVGARVGLSRCRGAHGSDATFGRVYTLHTVFLDTVQDISWMMNNYVFHLLNLLYLIQHQNKLECSISYSYSWVPVLISTMFSVMLDLYKLDKYSTNVFWRRKKTHFLKLTE